MADYATAINPRERVAHAACQTSDIGYEKELVELGDGCFAYLQPDGSWGWSNAGLLVGDGASLLIDTLFDLKLTGEMLETMAAITRTAPISTLVNTHANGDHCFGNELVKHAEIIASAAAAEEMRETPPSGFAALAAAKGEVGDLFRHFFGAFDFTEITQFLPTRVFEHYLDVDVGGRAIELIEVGPAHTKGDVLVYVAADRTMYTGDILFIGGTPVSWAGPLSNWIAACDLILGMDVETVVPGHGPVTDKSGVAAVRDELVFVDAEATKRFREGIPAWQAVQEIYRLTDGTFGERGRVAVNVETVYRTLDPQYRGANMLELLRRMVTLES